MATSTWLPLLVAVLGIAGTVTGVILTQYRADRRDTNMWARERDRERERWARDDADRTFGHRRDAYVDFYESLRDMAFLVYNFGMGLTKEPPDDSDGSLPVGFQLPTFRKLQHLRLYATPATAQAADDAYTAAWRWGHWTRFDQDDEPFYEAQHDFDMAEESLRDAIRTDLGVPETSSPLRTDLIDPRGQVYQFEEL